MHNPPPPVRYPLDIAKITTVKPGDLGPPGTSELVPGVFVPDPGIAISPSLQPIDVRDVIHVAPGKLAPSNYVEYLPGWCCPR
ncbi:hypothetical protein Mycsm_06656 (plasmid) [Mycobacterium sp. JS623]|uniref:hypothetical protein n=1 Tax=Mycobacterium sp. JS623 TaxID=212767 RepID=UPI0002A57726|nr:hypothetical protein [Mycobacterium sp. JS623]AGB26782.1 hypothetical protein Mycsm_06656 [Mycobacterium sp. JS623]